MAISSNQRHEALRLRSEMPGCYRPAAGSPRREGRCGLAWRSPLPASRAARLLKGSAPREGDIRPDSRVRVQAELRRPPHQRAAPTPPLSPALGGWRLEGTPDSRGSIFAALPIMFQVIGQMPEQISSIRSGVRKPMAATTWGTTCSPISQGSDSPSTGMYCDGTSDQSNFQRRIKQRGYASLVEFTSNHGQAFRDNCEQRKIRAHVVNSDHQAVCVCALASDANAMRECRVLGNRGTPPPSAAVLGPAERAS